MVPRGPQAAALGCPPASKCQPGSVHFVDYDYALHIQSISLLPVHAAVDGRFWSVAFCAEAGCPASGIVAREHVYILHVAFRMACRAHVGRRCHKLMQRP